MSGATSISKHGAANSPSRVTLMERQANEKGDVSMLAQLRVRDLMALIGELDKLVSRVKQRQRNCLAAVENYESELGHIDKEVANIMEKYTPMVKRLEQRKQERTQLQAQSDSIAKQFGEILSTTKQRLRDSSHDHVRHIRDEATQELSAARGYSLGKESTVYQKAGPASSSSSKHRK